uniref:Integrase, catalytic region, zinc finger, CCHC-type, peptidase aspartic, catalytic n=1 Tax=Tanacetum cinerariifolium TaxID=118510 RepID=A0A6L2KMD2_TANCI|nr:integrase, catalytic region, zinc finger, CCHC-type, peptidase aspartic, catalytic [Tanacetum cinerariifolium]
MSNSSQGKKPEVEDHRRNFKFSNNKTSVTACNNSLNAKTLNVNFVCVTYGKCVLNDNHDMCVLHHINGVNSRTKQPIDVPISTREPKRTMNQSVATPLKRTVALDSTNQKPTHTTRNLYKHLVEIILFIINCGYSKYMTGNLKLLTIFVEKFIGTMKFGNDQIALILGYGDLIQGKVTIKRVYNVKGLNHNLFSIGQFCDADLKVAFWKSTSYIHDLKGNDLLTGSHGTDLYSITFQDTSSPNSICLTAKATSSQAWLWHRHLFYLNFEAINLLLKNDIVIGLIKLKFINDHLYSSCIRHETSTARAPEQNCVVERRNHTLVEAARTTLSAVKFPLFFWAEAIATACFTQKRSLVIPRHEKMPYHIINGRKPSVNFFYIFGSFCYIVRDGENLDKTKEKAETVTTLNKVDLLFSLMFDELFNRTTQVVSKSSAVTTVDDPHQSQQQHTTQSTSTTVAADTLPLNIQTTPKTTCHEPTQAPIVTATKNINQGKTIKENAQVEDDEFINIFCTPVQERGETSSHHVDSSNMHTFYQRYPYEHRWMKHHPLEQVIGNPS